MIGGSQTDVTDGGVGRKKNLQRREKALVLFCHIRLEL